VDDPTPCRNPMWYEYPGAGHEAVVPLSFLERFARMIEHTGAAGKFSVVPCPGGQGRIDEEMPGISRDELDSWLRLVRERIAPRWSIGPEMLTHNRAIDLATMRLLPEREDVWAATQDEATLTRYIAHALQLLRNAGLEPSGVTSPWAFGREVEGAYADAIAAALRDVCGVTTGWYFLHSDTQASHVAQRIMRLDPAAATGLVSIVSGQRDFLWETQYGEPASIDHVLAPDASSGRLADLFAGGGPIVLTTHWQSLFSNGRGTGLDALEVLCERINGAWGRRIRWTTTQELAAYRVAGETARIESSGARRMVFHAPFACREFTYIVPVPAGTPTLCFDGQPLERMPDGTDELVEGCWTLHTDGAMVCVALHDGGELLWR
jgi:hypothetical protein